MEKVISIIIPIYNSENTLSNTLNSIVNQDFDKNYEIILINDGSTDKSEEICLGYLKKYNNIIYKKINNSGVSRARNMALSLAKGKYVMFIDSDDTFENNALNIMYNNIISNDYDIVISGYRRININNGKIVVKRMNNKNYDRNNFYQLIEEAQNNNLFNQLWNKIFKLEIIKDNKINFDTNISLGEDYKFILTYFNYIKNALCIDDVIYNYSNSINGLNTVYRRNRLQINMDNMKILEEYYIKNNYNLNYVNKKYVKTIISGINNICKSNNKNYINTELQRIIEDDFINEKIDEINDNYNSIILKIIAKKNTKIFKLIGKLSYLYEKLYRKIKLGY